MTRRNALSMRSSQFGLAAKRLTVLRSERASLNSSVSSTMRGSGDHHSTGWPSLYHGNTPFK